MNEYPIFRWDAVLAPNGINKLPMIYIKPDLDFINFLQANPSGITVVIKGTNTIYDNKPIPASVGQGPSFMPNYMRCKGYVVIVLDCIWYGYPPDNSVLGTVELSHLSNSLDL